MKEIMAGHDESGNKFNKIKRTCARPGCGVVFVGIQGNKKYCSPCSDIVARERVEAAKEDRKQK